MATYPIRSVCRLSIRIPAMQAARKEEQNMEESEVEGGQSKEGRH